MISKPTFSRAGMCPNVVTALISAQKANIALDFKMAPLSIWQVVMWPRLFKCPLTESDQYPPRGSPLPKDGIQLIAKARVTVRANIKQLVGGAR